jgi:Uncharacterised nucleotidyltransferase
MTDGRLLALALTRPAETAALDDASWTALLAMARAELLLGTLACRVEGLALPHAAQAILADARAEAEHQRRQALWEAEMARRALAGIDAPIVLLKGTAYVAAGLSAGRGRHIGDLDILVPRGALDHVETALIAAGWEWVKPDPYDDAYYRRWMHELPPLIHRDRDRMIDVHHTILPLTARPTPDAAALIAVSVPLENGLRVLSPADMIVHAAAHLFADGDLAGGMRNLWDIDRLLREFGEAPGFWFDLGARAAIHGLARAVAQAARQAAALYETPIPETWRGWDSADALFARRILARDGWGRATRPVTRLGFYLRSHARRMPPGMLARHLWTKWRRGAGDRAR